MAADRLPDPEPKACQQFGLHEPHEWNTGIRRYACPGSPVSAAVSPVEPPEAMERTKDADFDRRVLVESFKQAADEADSRLAKMNAAAMLVLRVRLRLDALDASESDGKPLMRFPTERRLLDEALEVLTDA